MDRWMRLVFGLSCLGLFLFSGLPGVEAQDNKPGKVYMVVIDKLSIFDIGPDMPCLLEITEKGGIGLASTRTLRGRNTLDTNVTIGAGNLGRVYGSGIMAFNQDEIMDVSAVELTAKERYQALTDMNPGDNACLVINLPEIVMRIEQEKVKSMPGAMGQVLRENGYMICILGNADTEDRILRPGAAIAMDAYGRVALGDIGPATTVLTPDKLLVRSTDYSYLESMVQKYWEQTDVFVLYLADLARLEMADQSFLAVSESSKQEYLRLIDSFTGYIREIMDTERDLLLVFAPSPASAEVKKRNNFIPVLAYGAGIQPGGYLSSPATKKDFILANTDIAPTVLQYFGLTDTTHTMAGRALSSSHYSGGDALAQAQTITEEVSSVNRLRTPLNKGYVIYQIIVIILAVFVIIWFARWYSLIEPCLISIVVFPLLYFFMGRLGITADYIYFLLVVFAIPVITIVLWKLFKGSSLDLFLFLSCSMVIALNIDMFSGAYFIQRSVLGYDLMAGARYYGIGNEYLGILLGAGIAAAAILYQRFNNRLLLLAIMFYFLVQIYIVASPQLGAQSDGMVTLPIAYLVTLYLLSGYKIRPSAVAAIIVFVMAGIIGFTCYDMTRPWELQSHIGQAANRIMAGGWSEALTIVTRKSATNLKLIRYTIWSWIFIISLAALALLFYRPVGAMQKLNQKYPYIVKGFIGIVTGAFVGLLINDSGIVLAATASIYLIVLSLLVILQLYHKPPNYN